MRSIWLTGLGILALLAVGAGRAEAAAITCSATIGGTLFTGTVDPAISCIGPFDGIDVYPNDLNAFGFTWSSQDKDEDGTNEAPVNGADESALSVSGLGTTGGTATSTFTITPTGSQCSSEDCNLFVVALKWDGVYAYWNLGQVLVPTTFQWTTDPNALSHASLFGRIGTPTEGDNPVPEPGSMLLLGTGLFGLGVAARRRLQR